VWVVVGLGNPGRRYRATRHNMGFRVVDRLADRWAVQVRREAHHALVGEARRDGTRVLLVKPQTFMNASNQAVSSLKRFYRFGLQDLILIHDDVDLDPGRVRIRQGGGTGGNRGVAAVIDALGDPGFVRVKVGVGRPPANCSTADHVLTAPAAHELSLLESACDRAADAVEILLADGAAEAMNRINQREKRNGGSPL